MRHAAGTIAVLAALALSGCQRGPAPKVRQSGEPLEPVALAMPTPAAAPSPHPADEEPEWRALADGSGAGFGYGGERPLFTLACRSGVLVVTRIVAAPVGAQAMFALIGNRKILRLPVDAIADPSGRGGYVWRGSLAPGDPAAEVFMGRELTATLPGGGEVKLTGSPLERAVIEQCRNKPATAVPPSPEKPE